MIFKVSINKLFCFNFSNPSTSRTRMILAADESLAEFNLRMQRYVNTQFAEFVQVNRKAFVLKTFEYFDFVVHCLFQQELFYHFNEVDRFALLSF